MPFRETTVLVINRNTEDRSVFADPRLEESCAITLVDGHADAIEALSLDPYDLVMVDATDTEIDVPAVVRYLEGAGDNDLTPVVGILSPETINRAKTLFEEGVADFVIRPLRATFIIARVQAAVRAKQLRAELASQLENFKVLNQIGIALSAEKDLDRLLEMILLHAKEITNSDGGSLYLRTEDDRLKFAIMRTDSLNFALGGTTGKDIPFPPLPMYNQETGEPNHRNIATHAALSGQSVNIPDAYEAEGFDFSGTRAFDEKTGYRSKSFLTIPMKNSAGEVNGVLQLLNARDVRTDTVVAFSDAAQRMIESLASQAAVAVDNQMLLQGQKELLDSFIKLIAAAIDAKSPYTGGHCARVPVLTEMLVDAACDAEIGPFSAFYLNEEQRYELHTAAWLHDCGKVTTPEYVVDKATKLETIFDRVELVKTRFEVLKRDAEITYLRACAASGADLTALEAAFEQQIAQYDDDCAFICQANVGGEYMTDDHVARIEAIAKYQWRTPEGETASLLSENESYNLTIRKGTLTPEEREVINHHIVMTIEMLEKLPFPKHLRNVPEFAGGHHERMDGKGYPRGLSKDEMSVPARMMAIADVFEALTAADRPYKRAMKLSTAMDILGKMKLEQHIDPELFDLFVENGIHIKYAEQFLTPEQIDEVDVTHYLGPIPDVEAQKKSA